MAVHASEGGVGGYLYQYDADGQMRIAAYCSRAFTPTERKWSTLEQESYAVLFAVTKFDSWAVAAWAPLQFAFGSSQRAVFVDASSA